MVKKHIFFISLAVLVCEALGYWFIVSFSEQDGRCEATFTVLSCNIGIEECGSGPPKGLTDISQWILDVERPDILLLQEFMGGVNVENLVDRLSYRDSVSGRSCSSQTSQVILSDFPLIEVDDLNFNPYNNGDTAM